MDEPVNTHKDTRSTRSVFTVINPGLVIIGSKDIHRSSVAPELRQCKGVLAFWCG